MPETPTEHPDDAHDDVREDADAALRHEAGDGTPPGGAAAAEWAAFNEMGLAYAQLGDWPSAADAFAAALEAAPPEDAAPAVHAVLLSNRAHACFHVAPADAVEAARRALTLRLAFGDADDAPVARARADLAVCLAVAGETHDAWSELQGALRAMEGRPDPDASALASLLHTAARLSLLRGDAATAATFVRRAAATAGAGDGAACDHAPWLALADALGGGPASPTPVATAASTEAFDFDLEIDDAALAALPAERPGLRAAPNLDVPPLDADYDDPGDLYGSTRADAAGNPSADIAAADAGRTSDAGDDGGPSVDRAADDPLGFSVEYGVPRDLLFGDQDAA